MAHTPTHVTDATPDGVCRSHLLTVREAAELLRISPVTVYERVRRNPDLYGRVSLGGREVRVRAAAILRLIGGEG